MIYNKLASAIYNDIVSGLRGMHGTATMSIEQLEDDIIDERLQIIKEYSLKGILPKNDLLLSLNCIDVDCKSLERCNCGTTGETPVAHFEIPQVISQYGKQAIEYIGSTDRQNKFTIVTSLSEFNNRKYRKRS